MLSTVSNVFIYDQRPNSQYGGFLGAGVHIYIYIICILYIYIYVYAILHICIYLFFLILFLFFRRPGVCAAWQRLRPRPPPDFHDARNASLPSVPRCAAAVVETA